MKHSLFTHVKGFNILKGKFKKLLAVFLGGLMFLSSATSASAKIEVVEFSDGSKLVRFVKEDLQSMLEYYQTEVLNNMTIDQDAIDGSKCCVRCCGSDRVALEEGEQKKCCSCCSCCDADQSNKEGGCCSCCHTKRHRSTKAAVLCALAILLSDSGVVGSLYAIADRVFYDDYVGRCCMYGAIAFIVTFTPIWFLCWCCRCCCYESDECCCDKCCCCECGKCCCCDCDKCCAECDSSDDDSLVGDEIYDKMRSEYKLSKKSLSSSLLRPLLPVAGQGGSECFLLLIRPEDKQDINPKPFFVTDCDSKLLQDLRSEKFTGLIQHVYGELRNQGVGVSNRYYLTKVGAHFTPIGDSDVMPEAGVVEVVVDSSGVVQ